MTTRRTFLGSVGLTWASLGSGAAWGADPVNPLNSPSSLNSSKLPQGKDQRLIVHTTEPLQVETPVDLLQAHTVTPKELLFVRNNFNLPKAHGLAPVPAQGWTLSVQGQVEYPRVFDAALLATLPQVEHEIVLQCSGNGRRFFGSAARVSGEPWGRGAVGNVRFRGVPLAVVFEKLKLGISPRCRFLTAEGADGPDLLATGSKGADFEHSIPIETALARSFLALEMNGEPLPGLHGGPVRLITPGYYATMNVKWITRLRLETSETANHHQIERYRTPRVPLRPGAPFISNLHNSDANWEMRVKSMFFTPTKNSKHRAGKVTARGVAWNDGAAKITAVELSQDAGTTWRRAHCTPPASLYAWYPWHLDFDLKPGTYTLMTRAVDALGRSQPIDGTIHWNPAGYAWNGADKVTITVG